MNKKLIAIISTLSLCVSVTACSRKNKNTKTENTTVSTINIESMKSEAVGEADTLINLGSETTIEGKGAKVENNKITITSAGTYSISGKLDDGQIIINAGDEDKVYIILDGVDITSSNSAPIYAINSKKVIISIADNTENNISDGKEYILEGESIDQPNGAIFSKDDLVFIGDGKLTVNANYNHGIVSKDKLKIQSGNIVVNSKNDGIKGKDCINITNGNIVINSEGDGIQSNNSKDEMKGYVYIEGGTINIKSKEDGIQAQTQLLIKDGDININSGGGSENSTKSKGRKDDMPGKGMGERPEMLKDMNGEQGERAKMLSDDILKKNKETNIDTTSNEEVETTVSTKALKAASNIIIEGGNINIDSCDDSIHSDNSITINGGTMNILSGDDGIHSDSELNINGGIINISKSYEGLESEVININDGEIHIVASDDGMNAAESNSKSSKNSLKSQININGGYIYVDASGDGIDSNGNITMKNGTLIVNGPTSNGDGSLDYDGTFDISGGILVAAGSSGMAQTPSDSSSQNVLNISLTSQEANTLVNIQAENGMEILTFAPSKSYQSVIVSTPNIKSNENYYVSVGGSSIGDFKDGLYLNGKYSSGTKVGNGKISNIITNITQDGATTGGHMGRLGVNRPSDVQDRKEKMNPKISNITQQ